MMQHVIRSVLFGGVILVLPQLVSAQQLSNTGNIQGSTISGQTPPTTIKPVTLTCTFVLANTAAKMMDVRTTTGTQHVFVANKDTGRKSQLEAILASVKPGDKLTLVGTTNSSGTLVVRTILREPKPMGVEPVSGK